MEGAEKRSRIQVEVRLASGIWIVHQPNALCVVHTSHIHICCLPSPHYYRSQPSPRPPFLACDLSATLKLFSWWVRILMTDIAFQEPTDRGPSGRVPFFFSSSLLPFPLFFVLFAIVIMCCVQDKVAEVSLPTFLVCFTYSQARRGDANPGLF